jgi:predicted PP-loop superfamily ATPase
MATKAKVKVTAEPGACVHRWKLETPIAAMVKGVCAYCNTERQFVSWERDDCQKCGGMITGRKHQCGKRAFSL